MPRSEERRAVKRSEERRAVNRRAVKRRRRQTSRAKKTKKGKKAKTAEGSPEDSEVAGAEDVTLSAGWFSVAPDKLNLRVGETKVVRASINIEKEQAESEVGGLAQGGAGVLGAELYIGRIVCVDLNSSMPDVVAVIPVRSAEQKVKPAGTTWEWRITARQPGNVTLDVTARAVTDNVGRRIPKEESTPSQVRTLSVHADVGNFYNWLDFWPHRLERLFHALAALGVALGALGGTVILPRFRGHPDRGENASWSAHGEAEAKAVYG